ncbi:MAG: NAD(P)/FAD-dependent oxidoreductase [Clostridia bacterium]|nr:NAD(P)/FAD-dependent oxidoreductase [Clostridia bacterium]
MIVRINNIKLSPDATFEELRATALKKLNKKEKDIEDFRIVRRSVDARKKQVSLVYSVEAAVRDPRGIASLADILILPEEEPEKPLTSGLKDRPVVVGTGPCGLFCALTLARAGAPPLILERGATVEKRTGAVESYWQGGPLNTNTNVQFGEGGAGTFSDGKLTTRIRDIRSKQVLEDFHRFGADSDILYQAKPHIGTDVLRQVIQNIRAYLIELGCEFRFETALTGLAIKNGHLIGIKTSHGEELPCSHLILAIGHSARDTYEMLYQSGVSMVQKPFSVGVRIEHLQEDIDRAMYGEFAGHPNLGAADYQLSYREGDDACYSFCMCPGGLVVASASEPESIVTNGMSCRARNEKNANAALCVNVDSRYFKDDHPLAGVAFQRKLEQKAFAMTKGVGAPVQTVGGFMEGRLMPFGKVQPSYTGGVVMQDLSQLFPRPIVSMLKRGITQFGRKIDGFDCADAVFTGPETRTSAPLRILRTETCESVSLSGLYPAGEGAGYAGGIMSAAVDGIRVAQAILRDSQEKA